MPFDSDERTSTASPIIYRPVPAGSCCLRMKDGCDCEGVEADDDGEAYDMRREHGTLWASGGSVVG